MQGGHHTTHTANSLLTNMPVTLLTLPSWCTKHALWAKPFLGVQHGAPVQGDPQRLSLPLHRAPHTSWFKPFTVGPPGVHHYQERPPCTAA